MIHCDEFDEYSPGAALLEDPFLSRFLPQSFVESRLDAMGPAANTALALGALHPSVIAPDGFTIADGISAAARKGTLRQRVATYTRSTLSFYRRTPARIDPQPAHYFVMTLALMNQLGVRPTIVLAPLQPWYLAPSPPRLGGAPPPRAGLPARLQRTYRFNLLDFSRLASIGGSPACFYDAVHLRPQTTRLVVRAVLRALPQAFAPSRTARS